MDNAVEDKKLYGSWPDAGLECSLYVHYLLGYRYHWHDDLYELQIILRGRASFFRGKNVYALEENDVILIDPGVDHASLALEPDSLVMVLRFPKTVFQRYLGTDTVYSYAACRSCAQTQMERRFQLIRFHATQLFHSLDRGFALSRLNAKANMELLLVTLHRDFSPVPMDCRMPQTEHEIAAVNQVKYYLDQNYADKITLNELSRLTNYHKNYISAYFKKHTGMNIYSYLSRMRFQGAVHDLNFSEKHLRKSPWTTDLRS